MTKVLLVEDDNNLREIYEARLQAEGYTIVSARDGEEALVVAKAEKPDLIISDIMMPKISGFEMLDILRNTDELKAVKIIMLTALGQSDDQQRADKLGADRYLVKSQVTLEDIVRVAHELLNDTGGAPDATTTTPPATNSAPDNQTADPVTPTTVTDETPKPEATPIPEAPLPTATPEVESTPSQTDITSTPSTDNSANGATSAAGTAEVTEDTSIASTPPLDNDAKPESTATEEAHLEAQIEDFVAGAEEQPNVASAPAETPNAANPEPVAAPEDTTADTNTKVVEEVVPADSSSIPEDQASGAPSLSPSEKADADIAVENADAALVDSAVKTLEDSTAEKPSDSETAAPAEPASSGDKKGGERVIEPLNSEPKTDINELLAKEESEIAKVQATAPETVINPAPETSQDPSTGIGPAKISSPPPTAPGQVDPNSIAL